MALEGGWGTFVAKVGNRGRECSGEGGREGISDCRTGFLRDKTDWIGVAMGSYESYALGNCNAPTEENGCEKMGKMEKCGFNCIGG